MAGLGHKGPLGGAFEWAQGLLDPGDALGMQGEREAQEQLQQRFKELEAKYGAYRPEAAQSRMNALNQQLQLFNPINDLLKQMYGQGGFDLSALGQNPMTPGMFSAANAQPAAPPPPPPPNRPPTSVSPVAQPFARTGSGGGAQPQAVPPTYDPAGRNRAFTR